MQLTARQVVEEWVKSRDSIEYFYEQFMMPDNTFIRNTLQPQELYAAVDAYQTELLNESLCKDQVSKTVKTTKTKSPIII